MFAVCQKVRPTTVMRRYFIWSFEGEYLGECFGTSPQNAREKFAAIRDLDSRKIVARLINTFTSSQS